MTKKSAILLIHCPDQKGLVAAVTRFLFKNQGNVLDLRQHTDSELGNFFMRIEWDLKNFSIPKHKIAPHFRENIAQKFHMEWKLCFSNETPKMALFVSEKPHCLSDILSRTQSSEWKVTIPLIISNHRTLEPVAKRFGVPFHHFEITPKNKTEQEKKQKILLKKHRVDFIVLARYMQILSPILLKAYPMRVINIHHSFLPAFPGAKPYHSAFKRGVKVIGATSHYVTEELDAGPIIEQETVPVTHEDSVKDLVRKGRDLEKIVLSRAIWHHLENKILTFDNRTIIF